MGVGGGDGVSDGAGAGAGIAFRGPTSRKAWTGGKVPTTFFSVRKLDEASSRELLPDGFSWVACGIHEMALRENASATILEWATMGYWAKKQFSLLWALSARVPDFQLQSFISDAPDGVAVAIVGVINDSAYVDMATGPSKSKATQLAAETFIKTANLMEWLRSKHAMTSCAGYLE